MSFSTACLTHARGASRLLPYLLLTVISLLLFPAPGRDDVHITYWAAQALAGTGEILNYNGERVEQSSSLFHTLLLALILKITALPVPAVGGLLSFASALATIWLAGRFAGMLKVDRLPVQLVLASAAPLAYWTFGGLEATLVAALVLSYLMAYYVFTTRPALPGLFALAVTTLAFLAVRPEAVFVLVAFHLATVVAGLIRRTGSGCELVSAALVLLLFAILTYWRYSYFGSLFPQPVEAKIGASSALSDKVTSGLGYCREFVRQYPVIVLLAWPSAVLLALTARLEVVRHPGLPVFAFALAYLCFVVLAGGDWMEGGRFFVHILPLLVLSGFMLAGRVVKNRGLILLIVVLNVFTTVRFAQHWSTSYPLFDQPAGGFRVLEANEYSFFETRNRVHYRDALFLDSVLPILDSYLDAKTDAASLHVMSVQGGMVAFYLFKRNFGRLRFVDAVGLASRDFTDCPVTKQWGSHTGGVAFGYEKFFELQDVLARECDIPLPEFIFDLGGGPRSLPWKKIIESYGYVIVHEDVGTLSGSRPFPGGFVMTGQFLAVREDLYRKNPVPVSARAVALPPDDGS